MKAYRERKDEARRLHADGAGVAEITRRLGAPRRRVERWIFGRKPDGPE